MKTTLIITQKEFDEEENPEGFSISAEEEKCVAAEGADKGDDTAMDVETNDDDVIVEPASKKRKMNGTNGKDAMPVDISADPDPSKPGVIEIDL